jgi:hypothetical protein
MKTPSILLMALGFIAAGCPAPQVRVSPAHPAIWHDTGTPPATVAQERGRKVSAGS